MPIIGVAGSKQLSTNLFQARSFRQRVPFQEKQNCDRIQRFQVQVPANQTRLQILDYKALASSDTVRYVYLDSDVEGVSWWPIASTSPKVSPTTHSFGWLMDPAAPVFTHTHGARSETPIDHLVSGEQVFHDDQFPTFWQCLEDETAAVALAARCLSTKLDAPTPFIPLSYAGNVFDVSTRLSTGLGNTDSVILAYMLGMDSPLDLGEEQDGLEFVIVLYSLTSAAVPRANVGFLSYPYTTTRLSADQIPAKTPAGDDVWSKSDRNLCRNNLIPSLNANPFGWSVSLITSPAQSLPALGVHSSIPTQPDSNGGWAIRVVKGAGETAGEVNDFSGRATYRRVTFISLGFDRGISGDDEAELPMYLANVFFGPRVGFWRELRPYDYFTACAAAAGVANADKPWDTGDIPSIGILNPHGVSANIYIEVGLRSA